MKFATLGDVCINLATITALVPYNNGTEVRVNTIDGHCHVIYVGPPDLGARNPKLDALDRFWLQVEANLVPEVGR